MTDDAQLLRQYVETGAEGPFGELVQRHLSLVYHAAARQLGGYEHLAADVAQGVFLLLAAKARDLVQHASLAGWLHATTRYKVAETLRAERRRRVRETAALLMNEHHSNPAAAPDWDQVRPILDEVLFELSASDREAVLLRFFEQRPFADIAVRLRLTEVAAHKRVERALDKLRDRLGRRGMNSTAMALATLLTGNAWAAIPKGLAASVTSTVAAGGLPVATWGAVSFMSTKAGVTAAAIFTLMAGGVAVRELKGQRDLRASLRAQEAENVVWRAKLGAEPVRAVASLAPPDGKSERPAAARPAARPAPSPAELASFEDGRAFLRDNPDVREAFARYLRVSLAQEYANLMATLGLDEGRKARFLELVALGRRKKVGDHQLTLAERNFEPGELGRELRALLGDAGYKAYQEFGDDFLDRSVNLQLTSSLYATSTPLTAAQAAEVDRIVASAAHDPRFGPSYTGRGWSELPMDRWDYVLTEATRTLSEPQVEALREMAERTRFWHAQSAASRAYREKQQAAVASP